MVETARRGQPQLEVLELVLQQLDVEQEQQLEQEQLELQEPASWSGKPARS
ncbi:hypothetical protein [Micromonospora tarensis]|uniref:Uncharacterized protein n=1 Tax=Micromonospora tarensis TaxID=2806100 RepID=A0ABS1YC80_9ACTN|nr:hypothetical protein [Micromonospora tarensis]MBM0274982.1 hypothetical protein [Micromonospora tarensis]